MASKSVRLNITADAAAAKAALTDVTKQADDLGTKNPTVKVGADTTASQDKLKDVKVQLDLIGKTVANARVNADTDAAKVKIRELSIEFRNLSNYVARPSVNVNGIDHAEIRLIKLKHELDSLGRSDTSVGGGFGGLGGGLGGTLASVTGIGDAMTATSADAGMFSKVMGGLGVATGIAEPAIAAGTVALMGLSTSLVTGGLGLGAFGLALMGPISDNKKFKDSISGVEKEVDKWGNSLSKFTLRPIEAALKLVNPLLKDMTPFVKAAAGALDGLEARMGKTLTGGAFKSGLDSFLPHVGPAIKDFGMAIGHIASGLADLFKDFLPESNGMAGGLDRLTQKFHEWAKTLTGHTGFQSMLAEWKQNWPGVKTGLEDFMVIIKNVVKDMTGLSTGANSRALWEIADPLLGIVKALSGNPDMMRLVLYTLAVADGFKKLKSTISPIGSMIGDLKGGFSATSSALQDFSSGFRNSAAAESEATGLFGTLGGKLSNLGPMLTTVATKMGLLRTATVEGTEAQEGMDVAMEANPIGLIVVAIAAVVAVIVLLTMHSKAFRDFWKDVWKDIENIAVGVWHALEDAGMAVFNWLKSNWPYVLGILLGPIALAAALIYKHWSDIKGWAADAMKFIADQWDELWAGAKAVASAVFSVLKDYWNAYKESIALIIDWARDVWNALWSAFKAIASPVFSWFGNEWDNFKSGANNIFNDVRSLWNTLWGDIKSIARDGMSTLSTVISDIKSAFATPFHFVENDIWNPLAKVWDDTLGKLPGVPKIATFGQGGVVPGSGAGDQIPALLTPGERVLSVSQVATLGGHGAIDSAVGSAGSHGRSGAGGGPVRAGSGWSLNPISDIEKLGSDALSFAQKIENWGITKIAAVVFKPIEALLSKVGGGFVGTALADLMKDVINSGATSAKAGANAVASAGIGNYSQANLLNVGKYMMSHGYSRAAAAGIASCIAGESGGNPEAMQGGSPGGGGLIQWTPISAYPGLVTGNTVRDFNVQLGAILRYNQGTGAGAISTLNKISSPIAAADYYSEMFERPAVRDSDVRTSVATGIYASLFNGGTINEPIIGKGLKTGINYSFGEYGPELVTPLNGSGPSYGGGGGTVNVIFTGVVGDPQAVGKQIHQVMRTYKRHLGGQTLGIA